jgi:predicted O-linked N-acetylglucosamine transferase (SPINDLY family)
MALGQAGRFQEAAEAFERAGTIEPAFAEAHYSAGQAWRALEHWEKAEAAYRRAVAADPAHGAPRLGLGQTLRALQRSEEALECLGEAIARLPQDAEAQAEYGFAWQEAGRLEEAVEAFRRALALDPRLARVWYAAGCAESAREEFASAAEALRRALALHGVWPEAWHNLGQALFSLGEVDEAVECMKKALDGPGRSLTRTMLAVMIPGSPAASDAEILEVRRAFAESELPEAGQARPARARKPGEPMRVGYVSSFFHRPNWMKPVWALINRHDRSEFEIHLFSDAPAVLIEEGYDARETDRFHDTSQMSNEEAAQAIAAEELDLLVDLNGYSNVRRLGMLARKPAPALAGWFNMYATSGMACFDYLVGDETAIPVEEERFYSEIIVRTPGSYLTFEVSHAAPDVVAAPCLREGVFTFGCLASQYKITGEVVKAWGRILRLAPEARLLVRNAALGSDGNRAHLWRRLEAEGVEREKVELEGPAEHFEFLATYSRVDLALDVFPYNGGTTTTEALWQGVPVMTNWGGRWAARTSASILRAGGLDEFVAGSAEEYVERAAGWAKAKESWPKLGELRAGMRERLRQSPVCDVEGFARAMEELYRRMAASRVSSY